jgi:hypothetical protein
MRPEFWYAIFKAVPCLRQSPVFHSRSLCLIQAQVMEFVVDGEAVGQVFFRVLRFPLPIIIPSVQHSSHQAMLCNLDTDVVK